MISKELLSEVLDVEILKYDVSHTSVHYDYFKDGITCTSFNINKYELAHKCKEWAYNNDYYIYSKFDFAGEGASYITKDNDTNKRLKTFRSETEVEAIIEACEWIRKEISK